MIRQVFLKLSMTIIKTENLTKTFNAGSRAEVKAVSNIDLELRESEIVLVMGPSGSGKTTLLTMLGGLLKPTSGKILFNDQNITSLDSSELTQFRRLNLGFVFQSFNLLKNLSALENVLVADFGLRDKRKRAKEMLEKLGLGNRLSFKPEHLSGGERQRVAIARALINNPKVVLADEPTANLDSKIGHEVSELLCRVACAENRAVVIVSHDERIKDIAHRVIYIEDGKLTHQEIGRHSSTCKM